MFRESSVYFKFQKHKNGEKKLLIGTFIKPERAERAEANERLPA